MTVADGRLDMRTLELMTRKIDTCFGHLDVDGNGTVERDDLLGLGSRLVAQFGESPTSPKATAMAAGMVRFWEALCSAADVNGDGRLTPQEYRTGMTRAFVEDPTGFDRAFLPMAEALCGLLDTDGDGTVSRPEFAAFHQVMRTSVENADLAFGKLDTDGSGSLSVTELLAAMRDYYSNPDENADALGHWLFGRV
ncbi:EF-hand domain-containing protein [Nonomuraea sp. NPDC049504]|uniref:EF-hand domain-containing protein n=1 Tax=Nonomuraea sp. NPDC049504 TaxID=3154729 RepID=UPI003430802F